ncbi:MAG: transcription elongation factor GreA [Thermomicrobiales bacterium]
MGSRRMIQLTADGKARLEAEHRELTDVDLPDLRKRIQDASEEGDIDDNSEYEELKESYMQAEARIRELEQTLDRAEIIDEGSRDGTIGLGSHVTVRADDGFEETWILVAPEEASAIDLRFSTQSPVGRALIGHVANDSVSVEAPAGSITYTVVTVA